jgi:hypothetical protein
MYASPSPDLVQMWKCTANSAEYSARPVAAVLSRSGKRTGRLRNHSPKNDSTPMMPGVARPVILTEKAQPHTRPTHTAHTLRSRRLMTRPSLAGVGSTPRALHAASPSASALWRVHHRCAISSDATSQKNSCESIRMRRPSCTLSMSKHTSAAATRPPYTDAPHPRAMWYTNHTDSVEKSAAVARSSMYLQLGPYSSVMFSYRHAAGS